MEAPVNNECSMRTMLTLAHINCISATLLEEFYRSGYDTFSTPLSSDMARKTTSPAGVAVTLSNRSRIIIGLVADNSRFRFSSVDSACMVGKEVAKKEKEYLEQVYGLSGREDSAQLFRQWRDEIDSTSTNYRLVGATLYGIHNALCLPWYCAVNKVLEQQKDLRGTELNNTDFLIPAIVLLHQKTIYDDVSFPDHVFPDVCIQLWIELYRHCDSTQSFAAIVHALIAENIQLSHGLLGGIEKEKYHNRYATDVLGKPTINLLPFDYYNHNTALETMRTIATCARNGELVVDIAHMARVLDVESMVKKEPSYSDMYKNAHLARFVNFAIQNNMHVD